MNKELQRLSETTPDPARKKEILASLDDAFRRQHDMMECVMDARQTHGRNTIHEAIIDELIVAEGYVG